MSDSPFEGAEKLEASSGSGEEFVKKKRKKKGGMEEAGPVNINSLMDILTILLVFLIKSYSANPIQLQSEDKMRLPTSTSTVAPQDAIPIAITRGFILVDNQPVVALSNGQIDPTDKEGGLAESFTIEPLKKILMDKREEINKTNKYMADTAKSNASQALILADLDTSARLIREVLNTAGIAEFNQFRFTVIQGGEPAVPQP